MTAESALAALAGGRGAILVSFVLGALFGSFANVCIYRLPPSDEHPGGRSIVTPGSHCQACGTPIRWYDNLPLVSFLWLRGACRACAARFSSRYLWVELITALLFAGAYVMCVAGPHASGDVLLRLHRFTVLAAFAFTMVVVTFIDLDHKLILNKVTYPAIAVFYGAGLTLPGHDWTTGLVGIAVGYGLIRLVSDGYYYLTGREGLGYGDGKLLAIVGALGGWQAVLISLFAGSLLGSIISIAVLSLRPREPRVRPEAASAGTEETPGGSGGDQGGEAEAGESDGASPSLRHVEVPFGPFLAAGALIFFAAAPYLQGQLALLWGVAPL